MGKLTAKTMQEKLGFVDEDLKKPLHDDIIFWVESNASKIITSLLKIEKNWSKSDLDSYSIEKYVTPKIQNGYITKEEVNKKFNQFISTEKEFTINIEKSVWEYPIVQQNSYGANKFIVGYVDLFLTANKLVIESDENINFKSSIRKRDFYVEAKTEIKSLGELMRQLRTYKTYLDRYDKILIVCPDDKYQKTIEEQGFYFVKYQTEFI